MKAKKTILMLLTPPRVEATRLVLAATAVKISRTVLTNALCMLALWAWNAFGTPRAVQDVCPRRCCHRGDMLKPMKTRKKLKKALGRAMKRK